MESEPARDALAAYRDATRCSPELRAENLRAIEARVHGAIPLRRPSPFVRIAVVVAALAAAAIAVWIAGDRSRAVVTERDVREQAVDAAPPPGTPGQAAQRVARPPVAVPEPPSAHGPAAPAIVRAAAPPGVPGAGAVPAPVPEPSVAVAEDAFAREVALLAELQRAVDARQIAAAARTIATLEQEFPSGVLVEERWALHVMMHCRADAADEAASTAAAFARARPGSALARRLSTRPCPETP